MSSFGAIQHKIAEMAIQLFALEVATYRCANDIGKLEHENLEAGKEFSKALLGAAEEYAIECAIIKVLGSEVLDFVVDENVQIHGGMGFSEETNAARAYRDSRIARIYEGTSEINRLLSIDMLLKKAMSGKIDLMTPGMAIQKELMSVPDFGGDDEGQFAAEFKAIKNAKKAFLLVAGGAVQKLMAKLKDEQEIIMNASDMLIQIYTAESLLMRVQKIFDKGEKAEQVYADILKVYFNDAMNKINVAGKDALQSYAEGDELRIMLMGLKRFTKYEPVNVKEARRRIASKIIEAGKYNL
jgi:alkylation response protein AidB-like acyl-CoA dehydrogenase